MKAIKIPSTKSRITWDGEEIHCSYVHISQRMCEHDEFTLLVDHEEYVKAFFKNPEKKVSLVYTLVTIDIEQEGGAPYMFYGLVENVEMGAFNGNSGKITVKGKSLTLELERGEMMQSYSSTKLAAILYEITGSTKLLKCEVTPEWSAAIDFALQYKETDWAFLRRLCAQYNERFFYSGIKLIIGPHPEFSTTSLTYDIELTSLQICSKAVSNSFNVFQYELDKHNTLKASSPGSVEGADSYLNKINGMNNAFNSRRKPNAPVEGWVPDQGSLVDLAKRRKVATGAQMMYVKGVCKTCEVFIGRLVSIKMPESAGGEAFGTFRVTAVSHELGENNRYVARFEGVPADLRYLPAPKVEIPKPELLLAEVMSNVDPDQIGRITVKFDFDERPCATYIPVMTPDAGGNGFGLGDTPSRGFSFVPEQGDLCLVSFLNGATLSQPVVVGSLFHGKNAEGIGGTKKNDIKTIITRSGHTFKFDDTKGKGKIQLYDKKNNIVEIDTTEDSINITANSNITLKATNISLLAANAITATAGTTFAATSGISATITGGISTFINAGKDAFIKAGKTFATKSGLKTSIESGTSAKMMLDSKGNSILNGKKKVDVTSDKQINVISKMKTAITGKNTQIQGKSKTDIKGGTVHVG